MELRNARVAMAAQFAMVDRSDKETDVYEALMRNFKGMSGSDTAKKEDYIQCVSTHSGLMQHMIAILERDGTQLGCLHHLLILQMGLTKTACTVLASHQRLIYQSHCSLYSDNLPYKCQGPVKHTDESITTVSECGNDAATVLDSEEEGPDELGEPCVSDLHTSPSLNVPSLVPTDCSSLTPPNLISARQLSQSRAQGTDEWFDWAEIIFVEAACRRKPRLEMDSFADVFSILKDDLGWSERWPSSKSLITDLFYVKKPIKSVLKAATGETISVKFDYRSIHYFVKDDDYFIGETAVIAYVRRQLELRGHDVERMTVMARSFNISFRNEIGRKANLLRRTRRAAKAKAKEQPSLHENGPLSSGKKAINASREVWDILSDGELSDDSRRKYNRKVLKKIKTRRKN